MEIPSIPTDNLYKYLAIAGLVVTITAYVGPVYLHHQLTRDATDSVVRRLALERHVELLKQRDRSAIERFKERVAASDKPPAELVEQFLSENQKDIDQRWDLAAQRDASVFDEQKYSVLRELLEPWDRLGYWGLGLGLLTTFLGFTLWYRRVQKYEDLKLRCEALLLISDSTPRPVALERLSQASIESANKPLEAVLTDLP